jgi:hypothetical protein
MIGDIKEQTDGNHTWQLQSIYQDSLDNEWFQLIDAETLPAKRHAAMSVKQDYLDIGVDKYTIESAINISNELFDNGDKETFNKLWDSIRTRLTFDFNRKNVLALCVTMFAVNDEKIYQFSEYYDEIKNDILLKDQDAQDFFLTFSFEIAKRLSEKYKTFSETDLKDLVLKEKMLNQYFGTIMQVKK